MVRRLPTFLSAASLLLFLAVIGLWVRSYTRVDEVTHASELKWRAVSARGGLFVERLNLRRRYGERDGPMPLTGSVVNYTEQPLAYWDWVADEDRPPGEEYLLGFAERMLRCDRPAPRP